MLDHQTFGLNSDEIQQNCIITPFLTQKQEAKLGIKKWNKGIIYQSAQVKNITVIKTMIGALFVGDAVLHLRSTACENLIFIGSCGLLRNRNAEQQTLDIGSIVTVERAYNLESFSHMLHPKNSVPDYYNSSIHSFENLSKIERIYSITIGSLYLEKQLEQLAITYNFPQTNYAVDMECSAFLSAAKTIDRKAVSLLYISDIIGEKDIFDKKNKEDCEHTKQAQSNVIELALNNF